MRVVITIKENITATRAEWNRLRENCDSTIRYEDVTKVWEFGLSENMDDKNNMLVVKPVQLV